MERYHFGNKTRTIIKAEFEPGSLDSVRPKGRHYAERIVEP